jgi:hypothetical protein
MRSACVSSPIPATYLGLRPRPWSIACSARHTGPPRAEARLNRRRGALALLEPYRHLLTRGALPRKGGRVGGAIYVG